MRKSRVPMDHYVYPNFDNAAAAAEIGRIGKRVTKGPGDPACTAEVLAHR